ncbi:MAG: PKD domain-containing protein [Candidatus Hydrogenedentota bacterium]
MSVRINLRSFLLTSCVLILALALAGCPRPNNDDGGPPDDSPAAHLSVSANSVSLSQDSPSATVTVSNTGEGTLSWTASSNDPAVTVTPDTFTGNSKEVTIATSDFSEDATAQVTFTNAADAADAEVVEVTIIARPALNVDLTISPGTAPTNYDVLCDAVTGHPDPGALTYTWDFGDGVVFTGADRVVHRYGQPAVYTVRVTVSDDYGSVSDTAEVTIDAAMPATSETLASTGGSVQLGRCTVTLATGQIPQPVPFDLTEMPTLVLPSSEQSDLQPIGPAYRLETALMTADPFTVRLTYEDSEIPAGYSAENLGIMLRLIAMPQMDVDSAPADTASPIVHHVPVPATVDTTGHTVTFDSYQGGVFQLVAMSGPLDVEPVTVPGTKSDVSATFIIQFNKTPNLGKSVYSTALKESMGLSLAKYGGEWSLPIVEGTVKVIVGSTPGCAGFVYLSDPHTIYMSSTLGSENAVKTVFAHEYFHTIQHYNSNDACANTHYKTDAWFFEGTASWAQDEVYDEFTNHYQAPDHTRFFIPMNIDKYNKRTEYQTIVFWKWAEAVNPGVIGAMIADHLPATHSAVSGGNRIKNNTAIAWQDSMLNVWPGVDFNQFCIDALYLKNFDKNETGEGDLWTTLGNYPCILPHYFVQNRMNTLAPGGEGDGENNKKTLQFNVKQHLTVDACYVLASDDGPFGRLHVEFPATGQPLDAVVISNGDLPSGVGPFAIVKLKDLSTEDKKAVVPFFQSNEVIIMVTDSRWQQDPADTPLQIAAEVWVDEPCGDLPGAVHDVTDEAGLVNALKTVPAGDTIRLAAGTYNMHSVIEWPRMWDTPANVGIDGQTLAGAGPESTVISCRYCNVSLFARGHVQLRNLTLKLTPGSYGIGILAGDIHSLVMCNVEVEVFGNADFLSFEEWYPPKATQLYLYDCDIAGAGFNLTYGISNLTVDTYSYCDVRIKNTAMTGWGIAFEYANGGGLGLVTADVDCAGFANNGVNVNAGSCYPVSTYIDCDYTEQCPSTRSLPARKSGGCFCGK